jgi:hypothetical protein
MDRLQRGKRVYWGRRRTPIGLVGDKGEHGFPLVFPGGEECLLPQSSIVGIDDDRLELGAVNKTVELLAQGDRLLDL